MIYLIVVTVSLLLFCLGNNLKSNKLNALSFIILSALVMIIFSGMRSSHVGTDTGAYIYFFESSIDYKIVMERIRGQGEAAFWLLNYFTRSLSSNYIIMFSLNALIITYCYYRGIIKQSESPAYSLAVLLLIGPYFFHFNGARQGIALAIYFVSIKYLVDKSFAKYSFCIMLAFLFHKSVIFCLPFYFFFHKEFNVKNSLLLTFPFLIFIFLFQDFVNITSDIDSRYSSYGVKQDNAGGVVTNMFNIILFIWFLISSYLFKIKSQIYDICLNIFYVGVLINISSLFLQINPSGFLRLSVYFTQVSLFLLPISVYSIKNKVIRSSVVLLSFILMYVYLYLTVTSFSNLVPYF